ncbi:hypothetical protein GBA52_001085 [Prunus armeniaca]|nr:hypothetical protein GBA52_001085 [Prunus armeniaca]
MYIINPITQIRIITISAQSQLSSQLWLRLKRPHERRLARSASTFRRQGSSGLIWDDNLMLQREEGRAEFRELRPCQSAKPLASRLITAQMEHSRFALAALLPQPRRTHILSNPNS